MGGEATLGHFKRLATDIEIRLAKDEQHCEQCVWDGVAYWIDGSPIAQWISCEVCNWGNE